MILFAVSSPAQQGPLPIAEVPPEILAELTALPPPVIPSPTCPNCYTNACPGCYHIFEKVPGTPYVIGREIPNPAPLEPGEVRPDFDPETGLPIWYIRHQPFVGPTDEEPISPELPIAKIELERIQARHDPEIFSIPGVHGFGIGAKGFIVFLAPNHSESASRIPKELKGIPVEVVLLGGPAVLRSHQGVRYRPAPLGVGVGRVLAGIERREGTIMTHIVRNQDSIGFCCVINTLTAGHVTKHPEDALPVPGAEPPTVQPGPSQTASAPWGFFIKGFV